MEPLKTRGAALPPQGLTQSAGGCPPGPRPGDLMRGEHEGANSYAGQRRASHSAESEETTAMSAIPESSTTNIPLQLTRIEIFKLLESNARLLGENLQPIDMYATHGTDIVLNAIYPGGIPDIIKNNMETFQIKLTRLISECEKRYRKHSRLIEKNFNWLTTIFDPVVFMESVHSADGNISPDKEQQAFSECTEIIPELEETDIGKVNASRSRTHSVTEPETVSMDPSTSKKQKSMSNSQQRRVRKRLAEELEDQPAAKILQIFSKIVTHEELGDKSAADLEFVIKECLKTPTGATTIANLIRSNQGSARD